MCKTMGRYCVGVANSAKSLNKTLVRGSNSERTRAHRSRRLCTTYGKSEEKHIHPKNRVGVMDRVEPETRPIENSAAIGVATYLIYWSIELREAASDKEYVR